jgi:hypothetical protein
MFYIIGTEDAFVRRGFKKLLSPCNTKWNQWLDSHWSQGLTEQERLQAEKEALAMLQ